jgi:hypothetical protein
MYDLAPKIGIKFDGVAGDHMQVRLVRQLRLVSQVRLVRIERLVSLVR